MAERALATAFVNIVPGTVDLDRYLKTGLGSQMSSSGLVAGDKLAKGTSQGFASKIKGYFGPIAASFAASFAVIGVTQFAKEAVTLASDFAEQGTAVSAVFGKAAGEINKFAAEGALALGQSKVQILEASKSFGIYGKAAGLAGEDNAKFSTDLVTLATDLASFNNTSVDEAIQAIGSGLRGEAEPLRRFGVLLDDAALKAQAMKMGIYDGNGSLTQQQKVLAANAAIFAQTSTQQGDFARTSEGLANQQRILAAQLDNTKIAVGTSFLPAITGIVTALNANVLPGVQAFAEDLPKLFAQAKETLGPTFDAIGAVFGTLTTNLGPLLPQIFALVSALSPMGALLPILVPAFQQIAEKIFPALSQVIGAILPIIQTLLGVFANLVTQLVTALLPVWMQLIDVITKQIVPLFNNLAPVVTTLAGIVGQVLSTAIKSLLPIIKTFVSFVGGLLKAVMPLVTVILELAGVLIGELLKALQPLVKALLPAFNDILKLITPIITVIVKVLAAVLVPAIKVVVEVLKVIIGVIGVVLTWFAKLISGVTGAAVQIQKFFMSIPSKITNFFKGAGTLLLQTGKDIINGLLTGAGQILPKIGEFFLDMLPGWIVTPFKKALGIASPSKLFAVFGKNIIQGLQGGLTKNADSIERTMKMLKEKIVKAFEDKKINAAAAKAAKDLVNAYSKALLGIERELKKVGEKIADAQDRLNDRIQEKVDFVKDIVAQYGSALRLENVAVDPIRVAEAQNDLNDAQAKYVELLKDTAASASDVESARLGVLRAEQGLVDAQQGSTTVGDAIKQLQDRIAKTKELRRVTDQLAAMGLDKNLIRQIVESQAVDFAQSVIAGGKEAVKELNVLADEANEQARKLGEQVGAVLYNEGIEFARSVVQGLKDQEQDLKDLMARVAADFERAIKAAINNNPVPVPDFNNNKPGRVEKSTGGGGGGGSAMPWQFMAAGGFVTGPTPAIIGEAGPEVVTPLKDFERMMGMQDGAGKTINYYAAPNQSMDSEQALFQAMKRAKVVAGW